MSIKNNIKILRERYDLTQQQLAEIAGVTNKAVSAWESGLSEPRMGAIEKISKHLGIKKSNIVDEGGMELDLNAVKNNEKIDFSRPVISDASLMQREKTVELPKNIAQMYTRSFFTKVSDDFMNKIIPMNCLALIDHSSVITNGDIVAVSNDSENITLKRYFKLNNYTVLEPDSYNSEYTPIMLNDEDEKKIKILGKVVWFMSDIDQVM